MISPDVIYRIDAHDALISANAEWDRFAAENGTPVLAFDKIVSRPLWRYISDQTTRHLYETVLFRIRSGRTVRFPFRCDAPALRRFLEMEATPMERGGVEFRVRTLKTEPRPFMPLLDPSAPRDDSAVRMCAWCKKVAVGQAYFEVEEAVERLRLFDRPALPLITHGICPECDALMNETLKPSA